MVVMSRQFLLIGSLALSLSACQDVSSESKASFAISASDQQTEVSTMACREFNDGLVYNAEFFVGADTGGRDGPRFDGRDSVLD